MTTAHATSAVVASSGERISRERIVGFDVARSCALLGMILVHFTTVGAADQSNPKWLATLLGFLDGRTAATFVVLAGIGLTQLNKRAEAADNRQAPSAVRKTLIRRGLFLLALGFLNLVVWPGDILRVYGVSLLIAPWLLHAPSRCLLLLAAGIAFSFVVAFLLVDFEQNWDWDTLTYHNLWTPAGIVRNLFYDGFRSVLPWFGLILFGMYLGRFDFENRSAVRRVFWIGAAVAISSEIVSWAFVAGIQAQFPDVDLDTANALFGTGSMPALPMFLLAAGGTATAIIAGCVAVTRTWPGPLWQPFAVTGQMALTWYFAHIVVGIGGLFALGLEESQSLPLATIYGLMFFGISVGVSCLWKAFFRRGPLEWLMRMVAG